MKSNYLSGFKKNIRTELIYEVNDRPYGKRIKLKSMGGYGENSTQQLKQFVKDAKTLRNEPSILLDLRGNGGGSSSWGSEWIEELFGFINRPDAKPSEYLASPRNHAHWERFYRYFKDSGLVSNREEDEYWKNLLRCLKKNFGKLVVCEPTEDLSEIQMPIINKTSEFTGQLYVIIDWSNFSSAEIFIQELRLMPNVTLLGLPTDASTAYGDIKFEVTPGGLIFKVPTKVFHNLFFDRDSGEPITPDILINYEIERELKGYDSILEQVENFIENSRKAP